MKGLLSGFLAQGEGRVGRFKQAEKQKQIRFDWQIIPLKVHNLGLSQAYIYKCCVTKRLHVVSSCMFSS